jgi:DNA repair protein RecO (recombination protein O)
MAQTLAYILHTRPWRETSLLVDVLSQDFGRIALIAKGAKRPHSPLRGLLEPFAPVSIQFSGKLGIKNLTHAHWVQALNPIHPAHAMQAWYLSELCLRALGEDDPQPAVFAAYDAAMKALIALPESKDTQTILRQFEVQLLIALGLWPDASQDAAGQALQAHMRYTLDEATGWTLTPDYAANNEVWTLSGAQIHALVSNANTSIANIGEDKLSLQTVRIALRALLARALHGKVLSTREVWKELDAIATKPQSTP